MLVGGLVPAEDVVSGTELVRGTELVIELVGVDDMDGSSLVSAFVSCAVCAGVKAGQDSIVPVADSVTSRVVVAAELKVRVVVIMVVRTLGSRKYVVVGTGQCDPRRGSICHGWSGEKGRAGGDRKCAHDGSVVAVSGDVECECPACLPLNDSCGPDSADRSSISKGCTKYAGRGE